MHVCVAYYVAVALLTVYITPEAAVTIIHDTVQACHRTGILNNYTMQHCTSMLCKL